MKEHRHCTDCFSYPCSALCIERVVNSIKWLNRVK